jgi:hypothetical protein
MDTNKFDYFVSSKQSQFHMILKSLQLPLLIKEKVEYYYYRQVWLEKMEIMNNQYRKKVFFEDIVSCTLLLWDNIKWANPIWNVEDRAPNFVRIWLPKRVVYRFATSGGNRSRSSLVPKNYHYSSGLNDPNGYK